MGILFTSSIVNFCVASNFDIICISQLVTFVLYYSNQNSYYPLTNWDHFIPILMKISDMFSNLCCPVNKFGFFYFLNI